MPVVHLLRHGEVHNPGDILYGRLPGYRLSEAGRGMAEAAAEHLVAHGRDIARVVSSPLERAQETAAAVARAYGLEVETDERLIESGNSFEGEKVRPFAKYLLRPKRLWSLRNPFRPSWGEPYADLRDRMMAAVLDAARNEPKRESILVSHQQPIWIVRLAIEGRRLAHDPRRRRCSLGSLTSLTVEAGTIVRVEYAEPSAREALR